MRSFKFNRIYVIESLEKHKTQTGEELYNDLLRWKQQQNNNRFICELIKVNSKIEFNNALNKIEQDCIQNNVFPILHFEIHGSINKDGLVLNSKEKIKFTDFYENLININFLTGNNLFLTLAVCYGAYLMSVIKLDKPAPFLGFIGSFDEIYEPDILLRYNEFYTEFLTSFDLYGSVDRLFNANQHFPNSYRVIDTEETFISVYKNYLIQNTSEEGIKKRINDVIASGEVNLPSRQSKREFGRKFRTEVLKTREFYYQKHSRIFFMIEEFPDNETRFKIPKSYKSIV